MAPITIATGGADPSSKPPGAVVETAYTTKATPEPCPPEMALVEGRYCIDRWEAATTYPDGKDYSPHKMIGPVRVKAVSRPGVVPQAFIGGEEADLACKRSGKHLCTTQEWQDACMGTKRPYRIYPYGNERVKGACNVERGKHPVMEIFGQHRRDSISMNDSRLNQTPDSVAKTGEFAQCVTPEGVFDLQGNLLEWTQGDKKALLMGGHYVEAKLHGKGCRYVTAGHGPAYHDYTTGFRCCKPADREALRALEQADTGEEPPPPAPAQSESRDPPGMRGFTNAMGKLPKLVPPAYEPKDAKCPVDMTYVKGIRCSEPVQFCKRWLPRLSVGEKIACAEFASPSECKGSRTSQSFCIDKYEFTPPGYDYPLTHVSYSEAQLLCSKMDKRLCAETEWEFACEGPEAVPYPYGFVRDGKLCNHDFPEEQLVSSPDVFIDRRVKADALPGCKSPFGVFNMVGNVDEWTTRPEGAPGRHAILRGGWWLIGRNRCRAATANHGERYAGVQTGFRCCKHARSVTSAAR